MSKKGGMNRQDNQNEEVSLSLPEPVTEEALRLRDCVSPERWLRIVKDAENKAQILREVALRRKRTGKSWQKCLKRVAPEVTWSCYLHWRRRWQKESGPEWERLVDRRVPPCTPTPEKIRTAVVLLRQVDPGMDCNTARKHLT